MPQPHPAASGGSGTPPAPPGHPSVILTPHPGWGPPSFRHLPPAPQAGLGDPISPLHPSGIIMGSPRIPQPHPAPLFQLILGSLGSYPGSPHLVPGPPTLPEMLRCPRVSHINGVSSLVQAQPRLVKGTPASQGFDTFSPAPWGRPGSPRTSQLLQDTTTLPTPRCRPHALIAQLLLCRGRGQKDLQRGG